MSKAGVEKIGELLVHSNFITRRDILIHNLEREDAVEYCEKNNKVMLETCGVIAFYEKEELEVIIENESDC